MLRRALHEADEEDRKKLREEEQQQQQRQRRGGQPGREDDEEVLRQQRPTPQRASSQHYYGSVDHHDRDAAAAGVARAKGTDRVQGGGDGNGDDVDDDDEGESLVDLDDDDDDDDDEEDDEMDEETYDEEDEEDDEDESLPPPHVRLWNGLKNLVRVVANVDNLYDDPSFHQPRLRTLDGDGADAQQQQQQLLLPNAAQRKTRNLIVLFWFVVLASSYAAERSTFKLLVDRAGPFRLFAVEVVASSHALLLGGGLLAARFVRRRAAASSSTRGARSTAHDVGLGISVIDVALMALLETLQLLLVFLTGLHVPPTLTVILIQFTLPLTAFLTQFVHPEGRCSCAAAAPSSGAAPLPTDLDDRSDRDGSVHRRPPPPLSPDPYYGGDPYQHQHQHHRDPSSPVPPLPPRRDQRRGIALERCGGLSAEHVWGSLLILLAVVLALLPAFYAIGHPDFFVYADTIPIRTAYNTLLYVSSCIPAAAAQLYKEHVFLQSKQPVNAVQLNFLLSVFEFLFASILAPLVFELQGLGARGDWAHLYPSSKFGENFADGLRCFFRVLPDPDQESKYYDDARCDFALGLAIFHAASVVAVGTAADKIVNAGATKVLYRGLSAGIVVAVLCMHAYDMHIVEFSYGPAVDGLNLACLIILILGSEVYHRVALQDLTFDTVYQPVHIDAMYE